MTDSALRTVPPAIAPAVRPSFFAPLCWLLLALWVVPAAGWAQERTIIIELSASKGGPILYRATRTVEEEGDRVTVRTEFTSGSAEPIQRTAAVYEAASLAAIRWQMEDLRSGERESLSREGDERTGVLRMSYRKSRDASEDVDTIQATDDQLMGAAVEAYIARRAERLIAGEALPFRLLVPSRQDQFQFRLVRDDDTDLGGPGQVVVRMEPDTWLIRRLVDPLFFAFDIRSPHRLRAFRGRSSVRTDGGDTQDLLYRYSYPGESR